MSDTPLRVALSHTSDFGVRPARGNSYIDAAFRALDRAEAVVSDMSLLPASALSPKAVSERLATDADLYVGIIGWRYGSPVRETPQVSYTQLEFRAAAEAGVPRLVFLLGEESRPEHAGEQDFDRQEEFRREIAASGVTRQRFDSPEQLETKLFQSITAPLDWDPALLRTFLSAVRAAWESPPLPGTPGMTGVDVPARRVTSSADGAKPLDPIAYAEEADRLVVLGAPGSGKSWLARRVACRAAENGLAQVARHERPGNIELPLFLRVSPFFRRVEDEPSVWSALVTHAIKGIEARLPNQRSVHRLRRMLEPRCDRYFVILDGLDEAAQLQTMAAREVFDTLIRDNVRLMLTSRPGSWRGQLDMTPATGQRRQAQVVDVIELQPVAPAQVRSFVRGVLPDDAAAAMLSHLDRHPALAEAARVPLIARLIAGVGPAATLREILDRAINHILLGEWRGSDAGPMLAPYRAARTQVRAWAWRAAMEQNHPLSGLADWTDEITVDEAIENPVVRGSVDNMAPVVSRDLDHLTERRRFVHQMIRERLVAEHVAGLSLDDAIEALEPHLWYDETWRSIVPAAVAAHEQPAMLLRRLLVGDAADPEAAIPAFRARDGLGELGSMLVRLQREAPGASWSRDPVLLPIFRLCLPEHGESPAEAEPAAVTRIPSQQRGATSLRAADLPRDSAGALRQTAQDLVTLFRENRRGLLEHFEIFQLLRPPKDLQEDVAEMLLELLEAPEAPFGTIGDALAALSMTDTQRRRAAGHLSFRLGSASEPEIVLVAAEKLARLDPDDDQRRAARAALATIFPHCVDYMLFDRAVAALGALGIGGTLDREDLLLIVEALESHGQDGVSLGFIWARTLADLGIPDPEMRRRIVVATLLPVSRRADAGAITFNDRLIDAGTLAGGDEAAKRLVGEAYLDLLQSAVDGSTSGAPILEPIDLEVTLGQFAQLDAPRDQRELAARLAARLVLDVVTQEVDRSRAIRICSEWRRLSPPEDSTREVAGALIEAIRSARSKASPDVLLSALLEFDLPPDQRAQAAELIAEEIVRNPGSIGRDVLAGLTFTSEQLRRLLRAADVPTSLLQASAAGVRRSISFADWKRLLPELAR